MSEETKTDEKDKGEDKKDEKRNQTPPVGGSRFFSPPRTSKPHHGEIFGPRGCPPYILAIEL